MPLTTRIDALYNLVADYGSDDPFPMRQITKPGILRWIQQFDPAAQAGILDELTQVFGKIYLSKANIKYYLSCVISIDALLQRTTDYWRKVTLLDIQGGGQSQTDLNRLLVETAAEAGIVVSAAQDGIHFLHLDDCLFSGQRVAADLINWVTNEAPNRAVLDIVYFAIHEHGKWQSKGKIEEAIVASGKAIQVTWRAACAFENRRAYLSRIDTLRPHAIPNVAAVQTYAAQAQTRGDLCLRPRDCPGRFGLYTSLAARELLEEQFLIAGVEVRRQCPNLYDAHKPLGYWTMPGLGFGTLFVTYLNCPNNAPLALWVSEPWYPLFRRRIN